MTRDVTEPRTDSRVDFLVREIGQSIAGEKYAPGDTLPVEHELCERYGVGRNAVREAIKTLAGKGFVRTERRAGTIVQARADWVMLDPQVMSWMLQNENLRADLLRSLSQLRRIIEPEAAALAAQHASTTAILRMFEAYEQMVEHRYDRDLAIASDIKFHEMLLAGSNNPLIMSMSRSIDILMRANFEISIERPNGFIRNLDQHGNVAEAIQRRDPDAARAEMITLLSNNDADLAAVMGDIAPVGAKETKASRQSGNVDA